MNLGLSFQRNKVNRLILVNGQNFVFKRQKLNDYGEPIKSEYEQIKIKGFYHESSSFVTSSGTDDSVMRTEPQPMILCTMEDGGKLKKNDMLDFNGKTYKLVDLTNVNQLNVCIDISLEVIQSGK